MLAPFYGSETSSLPFLSKRSPRSWFKSLELVTYCCLQKDLESNLIYGETVKKIYTWKSCESAEYFLNNKFIYLSDGYYLNNIIGLNDAFNPT
jgi:hypothetical protein